MDTFRRSRRLLLRCLTVQYRDAADANRRTDTAGASCFCRLCSVATLCKEERNTQTDTTAVAPRARRRRRLCCIVPHHEERANISQNDVAAPTGGPRRWFEALRRALTQVTQTPCRRSSIAVMDSGPESEAKAYKLSQEIKEPATDGSGEECGTQMACTEGFSEEDAAAVTIQAYFRAHLARRAYRGMKSLVRLQAVVRGMYVRRQAELAILCMQALVRLQVRVRARQLLDEL